MNYQLAIKTSWFSAEKICKAVLILIFMYNIYVEKKGIIMAETIGNIVGTITGSLVSIAISIALFAFTVWAIWTIATSHKSTGAKILWIIACLIFPFLGPLFWTIFGYKKNNIENRNI